MYGTFYWVNRVVRISTRQYSSNSTKKLLEFLAKMPKANTGRIAEAQRQRQQIAKKSEKYGPSTVYLQVLGSGARGVPNTLYLFTDQKRYLFNCGECTQRLAHEHKVKLSRLEHIFITSKTWGNIGGLPGLSLTLQDVGVPNITLHGPEGLDELYKATRRFVIMKEMNVNMAKCTAAEDFEDNAMTIKYVLLGPHDILQTQPVTKKAKHEEAHPDAEFEEFIHDNTDYYRRDAKHSRDSKNKNTKPNVKLDDKDSVKKKTEQVLQHLQKTEHCSVAYICTIKKRPGTLDLEKCVERGVKPGPLLGQLKSGQDVVLPDGTVVYSAEVKTPDDPGPVFIVLEVPDISYLREDEFSAHFDNGANPKENIPALIVHYTPPHILHHDKYRAFMAMFGKTTKHLVLNSMNRCLGSEAVHRSQHKLNLLDTEIFPLLHDSSIPAEWGAPGPAPGHAQQRELDEYKNKIATAQFQNIINGEGGGAPDLPGAEGGAPELLAGRTLAVYHLRPKMGLDRSMEPKLHIQDYSLEAMSVEGFTDSLQQFRELVESARLARPRQPYPRIVFLGTGSCIPSKTRNTSAILLQVDETRSMLLDCGEGTFGQLVRLFGPERVNAVLRTLHAVYVSHLHADHHIGLIGILQARREAFDEVSQEAPPVYLLAPGQIVTWLAMYDQQFQSIRRDYTLVPNQNLLESKMNESHEAGLGPAALAALGLQRAVTCLVPHCPNAFGLALQLRRHKITYSGDTMPCEDLVRIGEDSTLLIHEATMEDELAGEARLKMHSTTSQAVEVGRRMRAQFTLLTHFSQRYARLPRLDSCLLDDRRVGIAFDNMQICMDDLELLPHMYAPLQLMFAEHCVELEQKAAQRARRTERRTEPRPSPPELSERGRSPADSTQSAPQQRTSAQYRHTNASRLRFEMLNKASVAEKTRSKSYSPGKCATRVSVPTFKKSNTSNKIQTQRQSPATGTASNVNYVHVIDSRSKTLNTAAMAAPVDRGRPSSARARNISSPTHNTTDTCVTNIPSSSDFEEIRAQQRDIYGKSDLNKIDPRKGMVAPAEKKTTSRLQSRYVKEEKNHAPSNLRNVASPKELRCTVASTLYHLLFWRLHHVISQMSHLKWQLLTTIIALGYLFWTAFNASRTGDRDRGNLSKAGYHRMKYTPVNKNSSPARIPSANRSRIPIGINNLPKYNVETNAVSSNRSFKPQLEDIKSSFLLLNENKDNVNIPLKKEIATPKPKVLNETWRRLQLIEAKKKFKRKQFWNDSKFLNIDGLNWIPWK